VRCGLGVSATSIRMGDEKQMRKKLKVGENDSDGRLSAGGKPTIFRLKTYFKRNAVIFRLKTYFNREAPPGVGEETGFF
jgi:hypothetical protein